MPILTILELIQMATGLAAGLTSGKTQQEMNAVSVLEAIAGKVAQTHLELVGTPIDPESLKYEAPIE